jgi:hypothetical protein
MRGHAGAVAVVSVIWFAAAAMLSAAHAQKQKSQPASPAETGADPENAPEALRGKSIVVNYIEIRTTRPDAQGAATTRAVPYQLIVYISSQKRVFNRLNVANAASSDQVRGKDAKGSSTPTQDGFAPRTVIFDGSKMSVWNTFDGGKGLRDIMATFDETFTKCTGNVTVTIHGEFARQNKISGGTEELLSAKHDKITCFVQDGNALAGS